MSATTTDPWVLMVAHLAGEPPPPAPALPGRVFRAPIPDGRDPLAEAWDAEHAPATAADDGEGDAPD